MNSGLSLKEHRKPKPRRTGHAYDEEKWGRDKKLLSNQYWRLNNLYWIIDKNGNRVLFRMNNVQDHLYKNMWYWNLILKSRQHGHSTFVGLLALDYALFNNNVTVNIIAHKLDDAETLFAKKIEYPYLNLPEEIREARPAKSKTVRTLKFSNNSEIAVDTSARSDTLNFLHLSEMGKICLNHPDKAKEIVNGSIPALHTGSLLFIESTSEGPGGYFADWCKEAYDRELRGIKPNKRQFKLNFYPWHEAKHNRLNPEGIQIYPRLNDYFSDLKHKHNIELDDEQKAWYANEINIFEDNMRREHPSYFEEAFYESTEGAYYSQQFRKMREEGRITKVPYDPSFLVTTSWDIGVDDSTAIWFTQTCGRELHWIDYIESSGEGIGYYVDLLRERQRKFGYKYGAHIAPPDIMVREFGAVNAATRWQAAANLGIKFDIAPAVSVADGIQALRTLLDISWFDEEKCRDGYTKLEKYRKEYDVRLDKWKDKPRHDLNSHASDAARYRAVAWKSNVHTSNFKVGEKSVPVGAWT